MNYYAQCKWFRHVNRAATSGLQRKGNDTTLLFWKFFSTAMEGNYNDAISNLDGLRNKRDVEFPVIAALIKAHGMARHIDEDQVYNLKMGLETAESNAGEAALLLAARFYWHTGDHDEARRIVDKVLPDSSVGPNNRTPVQSQAQSLRGWIDLTMVGDDLTRREQEQKLNSINFFDAAPGDPNEIEAVMGRAKYYESVGQFTKALDNLNQAVVLHGWFLPALSEKAKTLLIMGDWEQALETAQRVLNENEYEIDALNIFILYMLAREGNNEEAVRKVEQLNEALDRNEPNNAGLYIAVAKPFVRICGRNPEVLRCTMNLVRRAMELDSDNSQYAAELGYQLVLYGELDEALEQYRRSAKLDETNVSALHGMIGCQLEEGQLDDAEQQLEFLQVISDGDQDESHRADFAYLQAKLAWDKNGDAHRQIQLLEEATRLTRQLANAAKGQRAGGGGMSAMRDTVSPAEFLQLLNPELLLRIAQDYMQHCGSEPLALEAGEYAHQCLEAARRLLADLSDKVPGLLSAKLLGAKAKFIANDIEGAQADIAKLLQSDPAYSGAHLLSARVLLLKEEYKAAQTALEQAQANDFSIRNSPVFAVVKAKVLENLNDLEGALKVLEAAMELPGIKNDKKKGKSSKTAKSFGLKTAPAAPVSLTDRVSVFIQLADVHSKLGQVPEASKIVQDALTKFRGTPEEVRVIVANSQLAIKRDDFSTAVRMLSEIKEESVAYTRAMLVKADIYLTHRKDKRRYIQCYQQIVEAGGNKSSASFVHLGEAYMRIQEPEKAIESFEKALQLNQGDHNLAKKIGVALVTTHDYLKAIDYYETAVDSAPDSSELHYSLAELWYKLQEFPRAIRVIARALERSSNDGGGGSSQESKQGGGGKGSAGADPAAMKADVKLLMLLADVHGGAENMERVPETLMKARSLQTSLIDAMRGESAEAVRKEHTVMANVCTKLAQHYEKCRNDEKAMQYYNEALRADDAHEPSILLLAKMHLRRGELEACQQQCVTLMRISKDEVSEEPSMMLADLMFRRNEYDTATFQFQQLLEKKPNNFQALSRLIMLLRRAGKLDEAVDYIKNAAKHSTRAVHLPGLNYCKGLQARYTNQVHDAIKHFNLARRDAEFGEQAIIHMIEIYLNPDNENIWEDDNADDGGGDDGDEDGHPPEQGGGSKDMSDVVRVADKLMRELPQRPKSLRHQVLEGYAMMATKSKNQVEAAIQKFVALLETERDYVPALLGLATGFMIQKQMPKARNQLKRISKMNFDKELADDFERSYLLLSDIYIQRGKYDLAQELCKRCLNYNRSCAKAWEYMGLVMEKEQSYRDAADHYEQAWKFEGEASATVGYKLAFNYLKARRYVEAINVCHKVLGMYPDYPKIKRDILEKARSSLRA